MKSRHRGEIATFQEGRLQVTLTNLETGESLELHTSGDMVWDTADANFTAIKDAFFGGTAVEFAVMDGDIETTGSQGLRASMSITGFSRSEALEEAIMVNVTAKPTYSANPPEWMTVT